MRSAFVAVLLHVSVAVAAAEVSCSDMGFSSALLCSGCEKLEAQVGKDHEASNECRKCCTQDSTSHDVKYHTAQLQICK